jgi:hypothetical protein
LPDRSAIAAQQTPIQAPNRSAMSVAHSNSSNAFKSFKPVDALDHSIRRLIFSPLIRQHNLG